MSEYLRSQADYLGLSPLQAGINPGWETERFSTGTVTWATRSTTIFPSPESWDQASGRGTCEGPAMRESGHNLVHARGQHRRRGSDQACSPRSAFPPRADSAILPVSASPLVRRGHGERLSSQARGLEGRETHSGLPGLVHSVQEPRVFSLQASTDRRAPPCVGPHPVQLCLRASHKRNHILK